VEASQDGGMGRHLIKISIQRSESALRIEINSLKGFCCARVPSVSTKFDHFRPRIGTGTDTSSKPAFLEIRSLLLLPELLRSVPRVGELRKGERSDPNTIARSRDEESPQT
jgi:hypothetical protein